MTRFIFILFPFLLFSANLKIINLKENNDVISVVFNKDIDLSYFKKHGIKDGIYYDIEAECTLKKQTFELNDDSITIAQNNKEITRIVIQTKNIDNLNFDINKNTLFLSFKVASKNVIANLFDSIDDNKQIKPKQTKVIKEAENKVTLNRNKIIVLDPGHGGKDCGAQAQKVCEKIITLSIGKLTKKTLESRGYKVYLTRDNDKYISLTDRTRFANDKNADIFISIHANSLPKSSKNYNTTSGIETYFLSTARSERARKVAELENKDDIEVMNYFSKLSFLNSINSQRLLASNKLAIDVQYAMLLNTRKIYNTTIDGGVREGPFWVLAGALMPSILIEVGYMSNQSDLKKLQKNSYQEKLSLGIADGIDSYFLKNF